MQLISFLRPLKIPADRLSVFHCILQVHSISEGPDKTCMFCTKDAKDKKINKKVQACEKITFPCLKVMVKFTVDGKDYTSLIHPDSIQARGAYSKVSQLLSLSFASKIIWNHLVCMAL